MIGCIRCHGPQDMFGNCPICDYGKTTFEERVRNERFFKKDMKVIGISAHAARSGKDTLAQCLQIVLTQQGKKVAIRSLANPLKEKMKNFLFDEFGIDVFTCSNEDKALIRPLLVAYGKARRVQTSGKFWTGLMDKEIKELKKQEYDIVIVPDIRYCEYSGDEGEWIKAQGPLFYISLILEDGSLLPPPNEDEEKNSPRLKAIADFEVKWPELPFDDCLQFVKDNWNMYAQKL